MSRLRPAISVCLLPLISFSLVEGLTKNIPTRISSWGDCSLHNGLRSRDARVTLRKESIQPSSSRASSDTLDELSKQPTFFENKKAFITVGSVFMASVAASNSLDAPNFAFVREHALSFIDVYNEALRDHYAITTAMQAFVLVAMGDILAQIIEFNSVPSNNIQSPCKYEPLRTLRMGLLGLLIGGIGTSNWLAFLEFQLPGHENFQIVFEKAAIDAGVWAPIANTLYLVLTPLTEGHDLDTVASKVSEKFFPVMKTELMTFFPYNLVSFSLIPPLLRPFTTGFVSMCFGVFISWITHLQPETTPQTSSEESGFANCDSNTASDTADIFVT